MKIFETTEYLMCRNTASLAEILVEMKPSEANVILDHLFGSDPTMHYLGDGRQSVTTCMCKSSVT